MTSIGTGPTWLERLNPRHWTLVWKLVIVGLAPALLALSLGALRIADQAGSAAALGASDRLFDVRTQVTAVSDAVRDENDQAVLFVAGGRTGDRGAFTDTVAKTDAAVTTLRGSVGAADLDQSATVASSQALNGLDKLAGLRKQVTDDKSVAPVQINGSYAAIAEGVDVLDRVLLREVRVPETAGLVDALTAAQNVAAQLANQRALVGAAIRSGTFQPGDVDAIVGTDTLIFAQYRAYQLALTPQQLLRFGTFLDDPTNKVRQQLAAKVIVDVRAGRPTTVTTADWEGAYSGSRAALDRATGLIRQDVSAAGAAAEQRASNLAGINAVILMFGLLIGAAIAFLVARALIRSLRVLRSAALDVAERRLPLAVESMRAGEAPDVAVDPVPIGTRDEVGQVARAFDAVHGQAVRLAADQAALQTNVSAMFVNLSRRSQALVERQLQLIEQLESNEQDADQLSNLFHLDHLATRMRRNSENLLVLAGTDLAKRNIAPVPMVDVLRAAVSEVEQYQRVIVQAPPSASIVGRAGSDLVHLLAELLDNATNFSPPDSQVVMSTTRATDGAIVVEIADRGVGMADHELSDANQRLGGPSTVDVSASRRMGLFVVGRLAARHGIGVRLSGSGNGPGAGLTASVTVPSSLVPTAIPAEVSRPAGRPVPAAVPAQARTAPRTDADGDRTAAASLPALEAPSAAPERSDRSEGGRVVPRPAANANGSANGLPTRTPGSSLRPDGPTGPPRGGGDKRPFGSGPIEGNPFDDGSDDAARPDESERSGRNVAEQARLDQEAAALRERRRRAEHDGGSNGNGRSYPPARDERRAPDDDGPPDEPPGRGDGPAGRRGAPGDSDRPAAPPSPRAPLGQLGKPARDDVRPAEDGPEPSAGPATDNPATDNPATDTPATDTPAIGTPATGTPATGTPATGTPATGTPAAATPVTDHVATDTPGTRTPDPDTGRAASGDRAPELPAPSAWDTLAADPASSSAGPERPATRPADDPDGPPAARNPVGQEAMALPVRRPAERPAPAPAAAEPDRKGDTPAVAGSDELFAPSVPGIGDIGRIPVDDPGPNRGFDLSETTPIFEEIASAWFRSNRPIPVEYDGDRAAPGADAPQPAAEAVSGGTASGPPPDDPSPWPAPAAAAPGPDTQPVAPGPDASAFSTPADEGWRAANGAETDRPDELTAAGLPKRRPRARLVPGSAGSAVLAPPVSAARSAENIRGRLSSYQQGVRQGRESRLRNSEDPAAESPTAEAPTTEPTTAPAPTDVDHDEES